MPGYSAITIIYNPNSTGSGETLAMGLEKQLRKLSPRPRVAVVPTQYRGHAEALAYEIAHATERPLIISSSGDGGYHEIVNGIMRAQKEGAHVVSGLLPAGNANDHFRNLHDKDMLSAIKAGKTQQIDLLKLSYSSEGKDHIRYAHSYIGLGLTPEAGQELNRHKLNLWTEIWIVAKVLFRLRPVRLRVKGSLRTYDSVCQRFCRSPMLPTPAMASLRLPLSAAIASSVSSRACSRPQSTAFMVLDKRANSPLPPLGALPSSWTAKSSICRQMLP
jgi:diacylglycerol kinase (ATP)